MVRCGLFGLYINPVCLKYMIHIAEAEIGVLDSTQEAGLIRTLHCLYGFYASLVRSINHCSLVVSLRYTLIGHKAQVITVSSIIIFTSTINYDGELLRKDQRSTNLEVLGGSGLQEASS
ncbi:unnamed protein product [Schistosoma margrebowiei]|uniref:Uncharacterized protein n=1 Tax=Schistosoma margrebowiei TaxID=48269 RepID=A0A183LDC0_9TREM|nr:unnamed protein product [Schistosoma margrebowiei]